MYTEDQTQQTRDQQTDDQQTDDTGKAAATQSVVMDDKARDSLAEKIENQFDDVFGEKLGDDEDEDEDEDESGEQETGETGEGEQEKESGQSAEPGTEDAAEKEGEGEGKEGAAPKSGPTLPDAYRRSLKAYGWEDEEIDRNFEALGDSFLKTAERIHANRNDELAKWAEAGRKAREDQSGQQPPESKDKGWQGEQEAAKQAAAGLSEIKPVDADELKKEYGEDTLIDAIVGPVNATIKAVNNLIPKLKESAQVADQTQTDQVKREVDGFFGDKALEPYREVYGDDTKGLSSEQIQHRNQVLDTAYNLMVGANVLHGRKLSIREALDQAHSVVAAPHAEKAAKNQVAKQAKQRNRAISQKPRRRGKGGDGGEPQSRDELENKVAKRLRDAFKT